MFHYRVFINELSIDTERYGASDTEEIIINEYGAVVWVNAETQWEAARKASAMTHAFLKLKLNASFILRML